ncbi:SMC domain protein [Desulforamulus reducens MI-1]|uniref:SMC domain protein n=1 Tax=Desulforamulus reducens (strain ATCC BAA-1160 / DSM 100696 / MI-1) TaxID=349161 RepID=A4J8C8_DESRM|nr:AAA family ATPase [Desulforamulus reducens]ABO51331.1 SMC domain protein [Desulforamulus reducens MI-1]
MILNEKTQYIRGIELIREEIDSFKKYPYCLPAVKTLSTLDFHPRVTFIVGENGTGKSTLLEAIAIAFGFNPEGGTKNFTFSTNNTHSDLHKCIKLVKGFKRPEDGFFLRAESFYNVASNIDELDKSGLGNKIINSYGGRSLHAQSHGESFFATFINRFYGKGLYLLDEPEAALSPSRQMALISRIHDLVQKASQFIIATHSPIIMAYPDAIILQLKDTYELVEYTETEHYQITRQFLNNTERMLNILMQP